MSTLPALRLEGELTIQSAADCHLTLLSGVNEAAGGDAPGLALDLSGVIGLDSAGVQLLMAARRSLAAQGKTLQLAGSNRSVDEVLATLGLADWLPRADAQADALADAPTPMDSADLTLSEGAAS
jgi:anti-anti-sigma factor